MNSFQPLPNDTFKSEEQGVLDEKMLDTTVTAGAASMDSNNNNRPSSPVAATLAHPPRPLTQADFSFIPLPDWNEDSPPLPPPIPTTTTTAAPRTKAVRSAALSLFHPSSTTNAPDPIDELMFGTNAHGDPCVHPGALLHAKAALGDLDNESLSSGDDLDSGFLLADPRDIEEERQAAAQKDLPPNDSDQQRPAKYFRPNGPPDRDPKDDDHNRLESDSLDQAMVLDMQQHRHPSKTQSSIADAAADQNNPKDNKGPGDDEQEDEGTDQLPPLPLTTTTTTRGQTVKTGMTQRDSFASSSSSSRGSFTSSRDLITPPVMAPGTSPPPLFSHAQFSE